MTDSLHRRARQVRSRAAIQTWAYRQRKHAGGVWFRLRRTLAQSREAFAISKEEADRLVAEGIVPEPVGFELEPPKPIFFVTAAQVASIAGRRSIPVRLEEALLAAPALALVAFDASPPRHR
jgi:hypothetical protein